MRMWPPVHGERSPAGPRTSSPLTHVVDHSAWAERAVRARTRARRSVPGALLDPRRELLDLFEGLAALGDLVTDLLVGVHDRGVVAAAEGLPDAREGQVGQLAAEVHGDLARLGVRLRLPRPAELVDRDAEELGGDGHDRGRGDLG